jgi:hypothetical protein
MCACCRGYRCATNDGSGRVGLNVGFEQTWLCAKRHLYGAGVDVRKAWYSMSQKMWLLFMCDRNVNVGEERLIVAAAAKR